MSVSANLPAPWQMVSLQPSPDRFFSYTNNTSASSQSEEVEEHPLMVNIRDTITKYRMQSAAHFDTHINVKQAYPADTTKTTRETKLYVLFFGWNDSETYVFRPVFRKHPKRKTHALTAKVQILDDSIGKFVCLSRFLEGRYPIFPNSIKDSHLQAWWAANGKSFNWANLPTELKEHVIQYCIDQKYESPLMRRLNRRNDKSFGAAKFRGIHEILDKLADWSTLLGVSHQVRAITLRLCFAGTSETGKYGALSLSASSDKSLASALRRLGGFYQMTDSNSLPFNFNTQYLADCYKQHPRIYPHLAHHATLRHGLRRIHLNLGFIGSMHFFKVTAAGFDKCLIPGDMSYEVFEQLPSLTEIAIQLPREPRQGWIDSPRQKGPRLFYDDAPCPRLLHRVIFERIAEVLTLYHPVKVKGFVDDDEWVRYRDLRRAALQTRKWSPEELGELYEECGGGIELDEPVLPGSWIVEGAEEENEDDEKEAKEQIETVQQEASAEEDDEEEVEPFFPPKCRCEVQCHIVFDQRERTRRRY